MLPALPTAKEDAVLPCRNLWLSSGAPIWTFDATSGSRQLVGMQVDTTPDGRIRAQIFDDAIVALMNRHIAVFRT